DAILGVALNPQGLQDRLRWDATVMVGSRGDVRVLDELTSGLNHSNWASRCAAFDALKMYKDTRAVAVVEQKKAEWAPVAASYKDILKQTDGKTIALL